MKTKYFGRVNSVGLTLAMALAGRMQPAIAIDGDSATLEEIIVTAQKREEKLQDVPANINVLSGAQLESQGLNDLADYAKEVPGLYITNANGFSIGGGPGFGTPVLRGVSTGSGAGLVDVFLDDIPMTLNGGLGLNAIFDPDMADIDHIEVLEGPQSTLYGANAEDGIIKYVTKQPDLNNLSGSVRISGSQVDGGGSGYGVRTSVNLPVIADKLSVRASFYYRNDPGFINNAFNGQKNVNWTNVEGGQVSARLKISDDLETTLSGLIQHIYTPNLERVFLDPQTLKPSLGSLAFSSPILRKNVVDTQSVSDTLKWDLHGATLTNIASYGHFYIKGFEDFSLYGAFVGTPPDVGARFNNIGGQTEWTDELRLASAPGRIEYLLGGYYQHDSLYNIELNRGTSAVTGQVVDPTNQFFNILTFRSDGTFAQKAIFGDLTYHLTDQIQGTVGIRRSWDNVATVDGLETGLLVGGTAVVPLLSGSDSANSYLVTVSYKPESNVTVYLRAASAFRPGGPQSLNSLEIAAGAKPEIAPDSMWNYEAGVKGSQWDQRISYSADVFRMRWSDLQLTILASNGTSFGGNVGGATSEGVETALQIRPVKGLAISVNAAYIDAKITADIPAINAASGQPLPYSPKWTGAAVADYQFTQVNAMTPSVGLTYAFRGWSISNFTGNTGTLGATSNAYQLPSYATLDVRGGLDWSRYGVIFRVNNVTNKYALTQASNTPFAGYPLTGIVVQPRTYGVSFEMHF